MAISIKQLQVFVAIAQTKQVSLAAEHCFMTQSAASMAIRELELFTRSILFERVGKRLILNDLGRQLLPKAEQILDRLTEFKTMAHSDNLAGNLVVGASKTTGTYFLPQRMIKFFKHYPQVKIDCSINNTDTVIEEILNGAIDIGLIEAEVSHPKLDAKFIKSDRLFIIADKKHPLAKKTHLTKQDLEQYPWVLREAGSGTRKIFEEKMGKNFKKLEILMELNEPEAIKKMIINTKALTCLSECMVQDELIKKSLIVLEVEKLELMRKFYLIKFVDRYQTKLLQAFEQIVLKDLD